MSYLRGWFSLDTSSFATKVEPNDSYPNQSLLTVSELNEEDGDGSDTAGEDYKPPAFPAINSVRCTAASPSSSDSSMGFSIPNVLTDSALIPLPPVPSLVTRLLGVPPPESTESIISSCTYDYESTTQTTIRTALAPEARFSNFALTPNSMNWLVIHLAQLTTLQSAAGAKHLLRQFNL